MNSGNQESFLGITQKSIIVLVFVLIIASLSIFKNFLFQSNLLLKSFGELSIKPEIALNNKKPTFMEFYAEWCEVCKEMAPRVSELKDEYEKDINFVFLNVDNPKWENYIRKFNVNGIPHVNLLNFEGNLESTFIGKLDEKKIKDALANLVVNVPEKSKVSFSEELSQIKKSKSYLSKPRSHS